MKRNGVKLIRHRRLEPKQRNRAHWRPDQLRACAAWRGCHCGSDLLGRCPAKCGRESRDKTIGVGGVDVDMSGIVLRPDRHQSIVGRRRQRRLEEGSQNHCDQQSIVLKIG